MKTNLTKAAVAGLTALVIGNVAAQESVSKPVGYETITIPNGFSYAGLRLHNAPLLSGAADSIAGADVTLAAGGGASLVPGAVHIFEVNDGDAAGAVTTFTPADNSDTITLDDDLSANLAGGDSFTIRPAATLASIFGAANESGLDSGFGGTGGADQVYLLNEAGGFDRYYYDDFSPESFGASWVNAGTNLDVDPTAVPIVYTDGIVLLGGGTDGNTFVVSGSVKLTPTAIVHDSGFNYFSSVSPAGATLETMFGATAPGLGQGFGGTGDADQVLIPTATGFDRYYYDQFSPGGFAPSWVNADTNLDVDPTTVSFDGASGFVINNDGGLRTTTMGVPSFYTNL